ncbi:MAG: hypothetical protein MH321_07615 [Leptospiraceae bacterium]|nr:hypothetical protein [Leptospiraceae bacterium]
MLIVSKKPIPKLNENCIRSLMVYLERKIDKEIIKAGIKISILKKIEIPIRIPKIKY